MTTTVVHSIGTGKDYSTVAAWWAACPTNLVTADQIWKGEVYDELTVTGTTTLSGVVADATRYPWLTAAAGTSIADDSSIPLRYTTGKAGMTGSLPAYGIVLSIAQNYMRVDRLQFRETNIAASSAVFINSCGGVTFRGNLVDQAANTYGLNSDTSSGVANNIVNNVIVIRSGSGGRGVQCNSSDNPNVVGNTIVCVSGGGDYGIATNSGYTIPLCYDNAIFGFGTSMQSGSGRGFGASDYNCTDNATLGGSGTHQLTSKTFASQFRNITSGALDLRPALTGSDIAGAGNRQATYTSDLDFYAAARSTTTPTIGAVEVPSTTVTASITVSDAADSSAISAGAVARTVTLTLVTSPTDATPRANLTGLKWAFWDAMPWTGAGVAPANVGAAGTTDASGVFTVPLTRSVLAAGATGYLLVTDSDGTTGTVPNAFAGPVVVT